MMWGLHDGVVSLGTTLAPAVGLHSLRPSAHNPIIQPPHQSIQEKFQAETKYFVIWVILCPNLLQENFKFSLPDRFSFFPA